MKKSILLWAAILLIAAMFAGCGAQTTIEPPETQPETTVPAETTSPTEAPTEQVSEPVPSETVLDGAYNSEFVVEAYAEQITRYYIALTEAWDEQKCLDNGLSNLPVYYREGDPLANVGFAYQNLDHDGQDELIIGAILGADKDPAVFEVWTIHSGEPVLLAQGNTQDHYVMQFVEEDDMWYVVNESSDSAATHATYYMMLIDGKLELTQCILFDATADEQNPWFMTYDMDWDASNDEPIDEDMANAILDNNRRYYKAIDYIPYHNFK